MSFYREQLENFLKTLNVKAEIVMDIGGSAWPVKNRVKSWDVQNYIIVDNNLEKNQKGFVKPDFEVDLNEWDCCERQWRPLRNWRISGNPKSMIPKTGQGADIIFCLEVLEYVWNIKSAFTFLGDMFKMNYETESPRLLYLTWPFVYPIHQPVSYDYLRYTRNAVMRILDEYDFDLLEIIDRIDRSGKLVEFYQTDGMHCAGDANVTGYITIAKKR